MTKIGLVLEGGGLRAAYTAGILSWFIDHDVAFDFVVGIIAISICSWNIVSF